MGSVHCAATVRGRRVVVFVNTIFIIVPTLLPLKIKMPKIVIHYFDMPFWRAEVSRLALHLGKVEFEDKKIKDFSEFKASGIAPLGQAPILEVDGKVVAQTGAIARYCGKASGFYPKDDDFAAAKIDEIIDTATDITNLIGGTMRIPDQKEKLEARATLASGKLPFYFGALETFLTQNGSTGFYVGSTMTIADLAMWRLLGWFKGRALDGIPTDIFDTYPLVLQHYNSIDAHPEIRKWMETRYSKKF